MAIWAPTCSPRAACFCSRKAESSGRRRQRHPRAFGQGRPRRGVERLGGFHHMHPANAAKQAAAHFLPIVAGAGDAFEGRRIKRARPAAGLEQRIASSGLPAPSWKKAGHGRRAISPPGPTGWRGWAPPAGASLPAPAPAIAGAAAARRLSDDSRPCTIRMRSKKTSGKGSASSSHSRAAFLSFRPGDHAQRRGHGGDGALDPAQGAQIGHAQSHSPEGDSSAHRARSSGPRAGCARRASWPSGAS